VEWRRAKDGPGREKKHVERLGRRLLPLDGLLQRRRGDRSDGVELFFCGSERRLWSRKRATREAILRVFVNRKKKMGKI
jgi:hypothetical protein